MSTPASPHPRGHVLALSGGVGGAKLAAGLASALPPDRLTVVVNTGDDFEHLGLTICPDIDSVVYAMAGLNDSQRGWGVADESWQALAQLKALGEEGWFMLGDRDLAMHLARSHRLRAGESLSEVTGRLARALGISARVAPMSDAPVRTRIETYAGWMDFQRWFVGEQCRPEVLSIAFEGEGAAPSPALAEALARPDLAAVIVCPSNPYLSVDPILSLAGVRRALLDLTVPRLAVSPLIGGGAVKGPLAALMAGLGGGEITNAALARHYGPLLSHLVIDRQDDGEAEGLHHAGLCVTLTDTLMRTGEDRARLAGEVLAMLGIEAD